MRREDVKPGEYYQNTRNPPTVVRIEACPGKTEPGRVQYVQIVQGDARPGGSSSWVDEENLGPITDPKLRAAARLFETRRLIDVHAAALKKLRKQERQWRGVLQCFCECEALK